MTQRAKPQVQKAKLKPEGRILSLAGGAVGPEPGARADEIIMGRGQIPTLYSQPQASAPLCLLLVLQLLREGTR